MQEFSRLRQNVSRAFSFETSQKDVTEAHTDVDSRRASETQPLFLACQRLTATEISRRFAVQRCLPNGGGKGDRRACDRHFPAQLHLPLQLTSAKMAAPTAMCNIETLNGREYKVKDMAMADFGCVRRRARLREKSHKTSRSRHPPLRRLSPATASTPARDEPRGSTVRVRPRRARFRTRDALSREFSPIPPASTLPSAADARRVSKLRQQSPRDRARAGRDARSHVHDQGVRPRPAP